MGKQAEGPVERNADACRATMFLFILHTALPCGLA
jgi:hypothetical protein